MTRISEASWAGGAQLAFWALLWPHKLAHTKARNPDPLCLAPHLPPSMAPVRDLGRNLTMERRQGGCNAGSIALAFTRIMG
jgi:hypothetical protein